jgi:hypothetical protein
MATEETKVIEAEIKEDAEELAKYDPEMRFRKIAGLTAKLVFAMTITLSIFHIYTAGFGVLQELRHRAFHLSFVLPLVFFVYSMKKGEAKGTKRLIFDVIYSMTGSAFTTAIFRELLGLSLWPFLPRVSFLHLVFQDARCPAGPVGRLRRFPHIHRHACGDFLRWIPRVQRSSIPELV